MTTRTSRAKNVVVTLIALALGAVGLANITLKATFTLLDDGVFWRASDAGVVAEEVAALGPGARAGVRRGDVLMAIDGREVLAPEQVEDLLASKRSSETLDYRLLRAEAPFELQVTVAPLPAVPATVFYYLSLVGFFSLMVGTFVLLKRPADCTSTPSACCSS